MLYPLITIPIIVGLTAQFLKSIFIVIQRREAKIDYFLSHGHMPSSHTALVSSLVTVLGYYEGISSAAFAISIVFAFVIIDDALRFRVYLGEHGRVLNSLIKSHLLKDHRKFPYLKERLGHKISEVIAGGLLGVILSLVLIRLMQ